jgi:hypothetical protein
MNCCGGKLGNTGLNGEEIIFGTTTNFILMPIYGSDGTKNFIDLAPSSGTVGANVVASISAVNPLDRLYPLPFSENVARPKAEAIKENAPSGNMYKIQDGIRSNTMEFWGKNSSFRFASELTGFGCKEMGYYTVDNCGLLEGYIDPSFPNRLYPLPMMEDSFDKMVTYGTDTTVQKLMLTFNLERNFNEDNLYYITPADLGYPAYNLKGLIPVVMSLVGSPTTTSVTVRLVKPTGKAIETNGLVGLLSANFAIDDDGTPVTITAVTESTTVSGQYVIGYSAVTGTQPFILTATVAGYAINTLTYTDPA